MMTNNNKTNYRCKDCFFFLTNYCSYLDTSINADNQNCKFFVKNPNSKARKYNEEIDDENFVI